MAILKFNPDTPPFDNIGASYLVCAGIAETDDSINDLCVAAGLSISVFYRTIKTVAEVRENVAIARQIRAQRYADQAIELSKPTDDDHDRDDWNRYTANTGLLKRADIQIRTLLTLAAKYDPELFGDRIIEDKRESDAPARLVVLPTEEAAKQYRQRMQRITDERNMASAEDAEAPTNQESTK